LLKKTLLLTIYSVLECFCIFGIIFEKGNMLKKLFTLVIVVVSVLSVKGQTAMVAASVKAGDILDLKETEYNFGLIPQGKPVTHIFDVTDSGSDSLKIANIQASCGCTTPQWDRDKVVAPGGKTIITVGYNAANEGVFSKTITVTYNGDKTKLITIKGEVWRTPSTSAPENKGLDNLKNQ
jgi:hypothetical protein